MDIRRSNDLSMEWLIAFSRWFGLLWMVGGWLLCGVGVFVDSWRVGTVGSMFMAAGFVACWFGWFRYGNEEWRATKPEPARALCMATRKINLDGSTWYEARCSKDLDHHERIHLDTNPLLPGGGHSWT